MSIGKLFYEQLAGSTSGHMAMVPNNPLMWSFLSVPSSIHNNCYAINEIEFIEFLKTVIKDLEDES